MKAVGYRHCHPADDKSALEDTELDVPTPGAHDLLVDVRAVSVNPVDTKLRAGVEPEAGFRVLGFDAAGLVLATGSDVSLFRPGDMVYYAGDIGRPGTNAERHLVDERIVGRKPESLSFEDAAALPLTSITAWELLFDSFDLQEGQGNGETLLVIGGAGGVGSILVQLAKVLTGLNVVATASRPETRDWCLSMGADHVINHREAMTSQLQALGVTARYVASLTGSAKHFPAVVDLIRPRGEIAIIDDPKGIDVSLIKTKALSLHLEFMFTRPMFQTEDMIVHHKLLTRVADLVDKGAIKSTVNCYGGQINAENLRAAHARQERGDSIGKTVLSGFR